MSITLGIDIGTSGTKTLAIDEKGTILASASAEYPCDHPRPGWSEQDPDLWWEATKKTVQQVLGCGRFRPGDVAGVGLSGQMHGSVFLDSAGKVIRPALLWNDQRTAAECQEIEAKAGGREALIRLVANPALTGFTAPKVLWVRTHEPEHWERTRQVLLPKDYVRYRLTGTFATEVSDASGTLLLDVANRRWSRELLVKLDIDPALLPACHESQEVSAQRASWGRRRRACRWAHRSWAEGATSRPARWATASCGKGSCRRPWGLRGSCSLIPMQSASIPWGGCGCGCHAVPGAWHVMGVVLSAGGSFQWFRNELGKAEVALAKQKGEDPYFLLTDEARWPAGGGGALLPALPDGRANAPFRPRRQGSLGGIDGSPRPGPPDSQPARGRDLRNARQSRADPRDGGGDRSGAGLGGRRVQPTLEADPGRYLRLRRPHAQFDGGAGIWRRSTCPGRHRRLRIGPRSVQRHDPSRPGDARRPQGQYLLRPRLRRLSPALPRPAQVVPDNQRAGCTSYLAVIDELEDALTGARSAGRRGRGSRAAPR